MGNLLRQTVRKVPAGDARGLAAIPRATSRRTTCGVGGVSHPAAQDNQARVPRGDVDNFIKGPLDSMTSHGGFWNDDDQIVFIKATKVFTREGQPNGIRLRYGRCSPDPSACPDCGSSDALAVYEDHTYCFSCHQHHFTNSAFVVQQTKVPSGLIPVGEYKDLPARCLSEAICRKFGYSVSTASGKKVQLAAYRDQSNDVVAQKVRPKSKNDMYTTGDFKNVKLFGQHLWKPGKRLVITEGEVDCLSYAEATKGRWPVVSIPSGAASAPKAIKRNLEFVEGFKEVVLMFDMDEQGRTAADKVSDLLTPGKCAIAQLPLKDANEMLVAGRVDELTASVWQAEPKRPDGIINGKELWDEVSRPITNGVEYPWRVWNARLFGIRPREIVTLTAGSGVGKSTIVAEIAYQLGCNENTNVGYVALEEGVGRTGQRLMSLAIDKPIHLPSDVTDEERRKAFDGTLGTGKYLLYDHFGSLDSDNLLGKLTYMVTALDCKYLILDHLSILVERYGPGSDVSLRR